MAINPVQGSDDRVAQAAQIIRRRDVQESAAKGSRNQVEAHAGEEVKQSQQRTEIRREEVRTANVEAARQASDHSFEVKRQETVQNRKAEDQQNPDSGNIVNVVA